MLSSIMTIVACTIHRKENWLEKSPVVMKKFGMTLLGIGPMRSARNLPKRKSINIPAKHWKLICHVIIYVSKTQHDSMYMVGFIISRPRPNNFHNFIYKDSIASSN
jgi:hypothetical protein